MSFQRRCKYWPYCPNERTCPFDHPRRVCHASPEKCHRGRKCRHIHPSTTPCFFGPFCRFRLQGCPYQHPSNGQDFHPWTNTPAPHSLGLPCPEFLAGNCVLGTHCPLAHPCVNCRLGDDCCHFPCTFLHPRDLALRCQRECPYECHGNRCRHVSSLAACALFHRRHDLPCTKFQSGQICPFGSVCRFSHSAITSSAATSDMDCVVLDGNLVSLVDEITREVNEDEVSNSVAAVNR